MMEPPQSKPTGRIYYEHDLSIAVAAFPYLIAVVCHCNLLFSIGVLLSWLLCRCLGGPQLPWLGLY